ncbi:MAG: hypothetical protein AMXMBFR84_44490 [Candidatus Hydrogenedentota bacterium]
MFGRKENRNALEPPPVASTNPDAVEILRVWAIPGDTQQVSLQPTWKDPGAWGLMLVDVARHAANAYANNGYDHDEVLERIRELFDEEWDNPTDDAREI